jgi:hypothetical protein
MSIVAGIESRAGVAGPVARIGLACLLSDPHLHLQLDARETWR